MIRSVLGSAVAARPRRADAPAAYLRVFGVRMRGSISPAAVSAIASAIQQQEGYYPGSVAYQNNNPGNLVYAGQPGAAPGVGGFASFGSYSAGLQALDNQITLDATRGTDVNGNPVTNISQLITSWAPPSENDTAAYIASVAAQTGYDPNAPLSSLGGSAIALPASSPDFSSGDLVADLSTSVDLSSVGLPSAVPVYALLGIALVAAATLGSHR